LRGNNDETLCVANQKSSCKGTATGIQRDDSG
jgi:hypothetical protein